MTTNCVAPVAFPITTGLAAGAVVSVIGAVGAASTVSAVALLILGITLAGASIGSGMAWIGASNREEYFDYFTKTAPGAIASTFVWAAQAAIRSAVEALILGRRSYI